MNWLTKSVLPKIKALVNKDEVKENLWIKCNSCNQMIFGKDLFENLNICTTCNYHMPLYPQDRLKFLLDENTLEVIDYLSDNQDVLNFKDLKKYSDRLKNAQNLINQGDCIYLVKKLRKIGIDYVCVTSGGILPKTKIKFKPGYQVHLAKAVKANTGVITRTTGMITNLRQANNILKYQSADLINIARKFINSPTWLIKELIKNRKKIKIANPYKRCF